MTLLQWVQTHVYPQLFQGNTHFKFTSFEQVHGSESSSPFSYLSSPQFCNDFSSFCDAFSSLGTVCGKASTSLFVSCGNMFSVIASTDSVEEFSSSYAVFSFKSQSAAFWLKSHTVVAVDVGDDPVVEFLAIWQKMAIII